MMKNKSDKAPHLIMNAVMTISIFGSIINSTMLGISTAEGEWIIGEVFCQFYALLSFTLVSGALWLTALAAFERWYKLVALGDYSSTFSEINTRILIKGVLMMAFGLCTGPLYGWGEYSYFKGLMKLTGYIDLQNKNASNNDNATDIPYLCQKSKQIPETLVIDRFVDGVKFYLENNMHLHVRSSTPNCVLGEMEFILRALHSEAFNSFQEQYITGVLQNNLEKTVTQILNNSTNDKQLVKFPIFVNESEIDIYRNIYLSFQELGICTLDISPVNTHVLSSTAYIIFTTVFIPFGIISCCGIHVYIRFKSDSSSRCYSNLVYLKIAYVCGFISTVLCIPYYIINILNSNGSIISTVTNFLCTFLFYNSSLCVAIPYIVYRLPKSAIRKHVLSMRTFSGDVNEIRRDSNEISVMAEYV